MGGNLEGDGVRSSMPGLVVFVFVVLYICFGFVLYQHPGDLMFLFSC